VCSSFVRNAYLVFVVVQSALQPGVLSDMVVIRPKYLVVCPHPGDIERIVYRFRR